MLLYESWMNLFQCNNFFEKYIANINHNIITFLNSYLYWKKIGVILKF